MPVTLIVMVVMVILASLGVNIGPLIAGAGVIGLAMGFGAQTLVKGHVSGLFFLMDDAFRLGEYMRRAAWGTVERFDRSLSARHLGARSTRLPYGDLEMVTNYSRDWAIMKLQFRMPYDTDLVVGEARCSRRSARR